MNWLNFLCQRSLSLRLRQINKDNKRRRISSVWHFFHMLPTKDGEKPICKCKKCGKEYIAIGVYGIGNLKRHFNVC